MNVDELHPLGVGEVLDLAIKACRSRYATLMKIVVVVVVPVQIFSAIVQISTLTTTTTSSGTVETTSGGWVAAGGSLLSSILVGLAAQFASAACLKSVAGAYLGDHASWQESLEFVWGRFRSVAWILFLIYLFSGLALALVVLPGVYLWISWLVAMPVLLLEEQRGWAALTRSRQLVNGRWWATFGAYLIASVFVGITATLVSTILVAVTGASHAAFPARVLVTAIAGSIGGIITTPFLAAVIAVIYFDLRVRKDGFDLGLLASGMGTEVRRPEEPPWPSSTGLGPTP